MEIAEQYLERTKRKFTLLGEDALQTDCPKCQQFTCTVRRRTWVWECSACPAKGEQYRMKQLHGGMYSVAPVAKSANAPFEAMRAATTPWVDVWQSQFWTHAKAQRARDYLLVERRLSMDALRMAKVGWSMKSPSYTIGLQTGEIVESTSRRTTAQPGYDTSRAPHGYVTIPVFQFDQEMMGADLRKLDLLKYRSVDPTEKRIIARVKDGRSSMFAPSFLLAFEPLLIVGGEIDALSAYTAGFKNVVSMTTGENALDPSVIEALTRMENIVIALDNDDTGRRSAKTLADRLGRHRCSIAEWPEAMKDANDCLKAQGEDGMRETIDHMIANAKPCAGESVVRVTAIADQVIAKIRGKQRGPSWGLGADFDSLTKGRRPGEVSVWTGDTGSGKSTVLSYSALQVARMPREGVLMVPLELGAMNQTEKWLRQWAGAPPKQFTNEQLHGYLDQIGDLPLYVMNHYGEVEVNALEGTLSYAAQRLGVTFAVIDHLNFAVGTDTDKERQKLDQMISMCAKVAGETGLNIAVVCHPHGTGSTSEKDRDNRVVQMADLKGSSGIKQVAHNVFSVYHKRSSRRESTIASDGYGRTTIYCLKARDDDAEEGAVILRFKPGASTYHADIAGSDSKPADEGKDHWTQRMERD